MLRQQGLSTYTQAKIEGILGSLAMTTGIIPSDPLLVAAQLAAEAQGFWPEPVVLPGRVWSDGSCINPIDPPLRRATWAVVGSAPAYPRLGVAPVSGRQTIGRAELSAMVWISRCPGATLCVIDAQYLVGCMTRCAEGLLPPALLRGPNGDLWMLLIKT